MHLTPQASRFAPALLLAGTLGQAAAPVASDAPGDYAFALPLTAPGDGGVTAFRLPQAVYLHARSARLDDLRLFDRHGNQLPFALEAPPSRSRTSKTGIAARIFPLTGSGAGSLDMDTLKLDIHTDRDGRLLSVTSGSGTGSGQDKTGLGSLILDVGADLATPALIDALRFELPAGTSSYTARIWLETSDDLQHWRPGGTAELNWVVNRDAQTLSNDRIAFEPSRFRYARLSWRAGQPILFAKIEADALSQAAAPLPLERLLLRPAPAGAGKDLVYRASAAIPVETVGLQFSEPNVVFPTLVGTYQEVPSRQIRRATAWVFEPLLNATFYRISQAGAERTSGDVAISGAHAAFWVLRPQPGTGARPLLRLAWSPGRVLFLANGNGPYTLAFGRDGVHAAAVDVSQVAPGFSQAELAKVAQASAGALATQAGAAGGVSTAAAAAQSARWRAAVLWGVLLAGIAMLAYLARGLLQQMGTGGKSS